MKPSRWTSITHFITAAVFLCFGLIAYSAIKEEEDAKAAARQSSPPPAVLIEKFVASPFEPRFQEVTLLAQLDVKKTILMLRDSKKDEYAPDNFLAHIVPLYAVTARTREGQPAFGSFISRQRIRDSDTVAMWVRNGAFGPIVRINGMLETGITNDGADALRNGPRMVADAVHVEAFMEGRKKGLAPQDDPVDGLTTFLVIAAAFAIWGYWRRRAKFSKWAAEEAEHREGLPDWNDR